MSDSHFILLFNLAASLLRADQKINSSAKLKSCIQKEL